MAIVAGGLVYLESVTRTGAECNMAFDIEKETALSMKIR
jgi:hypothetical protein